MTPNEIWRGKKPNLNYYHEFGSILNDKQKISKLDAKSDEGIFLGYSLNSGAHKVHNKRTNAVMESVNVVVDLCTKISSLISTYFMRSIEEVRDRNHICVLGEGTFQSHVRILHYSTTL